MSDEATVAVIELLDACNIPYVLVGSYASNVYGADRTPADADFVIQLGWMTIEALEQQLLPTVRINSEMYVEIVAGQRRLTAYVSRKLFLIEFFILNNDPHNQEQFGRRKQTSLLGRQVWIPTVEDMIIAKLRWASKADDQQKNITDAFNILVAQGDQVDWDYVYHWCKQHDTMTTLDRARDWGNVLR